MSQLKRQWNAVETVNLKPKITVFIKSSMTYHHKENFVKMQ